MSFSRRHHVPLATQTTLAVGGNAALWLDVERIDAAIEALRDLGSLAVAIVGGGSNTLASDEGFDGAVLHLRDRATKATLDDDRVVVRAHGGCSWDEVVAWTVREGWAGIECLSGIPGLVGAAPIQNIGAYGQELSDTVVAVEAVDLQQHTLRRFGRAECRFAYRSSAFKDDLRGRYLVTAIELGLRRNGEAQIAYPDLAQRLASRRGTTPSLAEVRDHVLAIRRFKSMVYDTADPLHRSAGSFFLNPVITPSQHATLAGADGSPAPSYPAPGGIKVPAAWLIENSGFPRGTKRGAVGTSPKHALAIINHGTATSADIVTLAEEIRDSVWRAYTVDIQPEPRPLGFRELPGLFRPRGGGRH